MVKAVLSILAILGLWFSIVFFKDFIKHKDQLEDNSWTKVNIIGFVTNFFDALGIGSFATGAALLKIFKQSSDQLIPGTLNVGYCIPVILEAFLFMTVIEVEPITLVAMLASATIGAYIGAGIVSKLSEKKIQTAMGIALLATAFLMFASKLGWMPSGGNAIGLSGGKLIVAVVANFILGALMTVGIGLYAPCMALVFFLGLSPEIAFPIMFGSCAFLMPVASMRFVKEGAYNRKASMGFTVIGSLGIVIAVYLVKSLPMETLTWIVMAVVLYTSISMLRSALNSKEKNKGGDIIKEALN